MVALKDEYTTSMAFAAGEHMLTELSLRPVRQTIWRRKHEIRAGGAPHFYMGARTAARQRSPGRLPQPC